MIIYFIDYLFYYLFYWLFILLIIYFIDYLFYYLFYWLFILLFIWSIIIHLINYYLFRRPWSPAPRPCYIQLINWSYPYSDECKKKIFLFRESKEEVLDHGLFLKKWLFFIQILCKKLVFGTILCIYWLKIRKWFFFWNLTKNPISIKICQLLATIRNVDVFVSTFRYKTRLNM